MAKANAGGPGATSGNGAKRRNREIDVMDAAVDVFWRKGYAAASVQDVAESVGVLKGSLYYYISSKEDLLFRILDDVHEQSRKILDEVVELDATPLERLRIYMERHVEWYLDHVEEVTVYFRDWRYLTGDAVLRSDEFAGSFRGRGLPRQVVDKVYRDNARRLFPQAWRAPASTGAVSSASGQRARARTTSPSCSPACKRRQPASAIIAALSVQNSGRG